MEVIYASASKTQNIAGIGAIEIGHQFKVMTFAAPIAISEYPRNHTTEWRKNRCNNKRVAIVTLSIAVNDIYIDCEAIRYNNFLKNPKASASLRCVHSRKDVFLA